MPSADALDEWQDVDDRLLGIYASVTTQRLQAVADRASAVPARKLPQSDHTSEGSVC
jgi:hypothetical protein